MSSVSKQSPFRIRESFRVLQYVNSRPAAALLTMFFLTAPPVSPHLVTNLAWGATSNTATLEARAYGLLRQRVQALASLAELKTTPFVPAGSSGLTAGEQTPSKAITTHHSFAIDYCMEWLDKSYQTCKKWIAPWVPQHGLAGADRSPAELARAQGVHPGAVPLQKGPLTLHQGFQIIARGGSALTSDNTVDRQNLLYFGLDQAPMQRLEQVGTKAADVVLHTASLGQAKMLPPEILRQTAASLSQMFRNNLLAKLGQVRVAKPGIEFMLGNGTVPKCQTYRSLVENQQDPLLRMEGRLRGQAPLDPMTNGQTIDERERLCQEMLQQPYTTRTPQAEGGQITPGGVPQYDETALRLNLYAVDHPGQAIAPLLAQESAQNQFIFTAQQVAPKVNQYAQGGHAYTLVPQTTQQQIAGYKHVLANAASTRSAIANRLPNSYFPSQVTDTTQGKNLIQVNGLTPAQQADLKLPGAPARQAVRPSEIINF